MARERPLDAGIVENLAALPQPEEVVIDRELAAELRAAVERLPDHQRTLIEALYAEDPTSYEEISHTHGIPIGGIGPTRGRALKRLRDDERLAPLAAEYVAEQADDESTAYAGRSRRPEHVTAFGM
jgi:DNA-directed RNA polymerase specialized sigma24 family protein